jgi:carbon storage regulator
MLVLTRRLGEAVVIDGNITLTVVAIEGNHARIGIRAPLAVCVDRQEVHDLRRASTPSPRRKKALPKVAKGK